MATATTKPTLTDGGAEQLTWLAGMRAERPHWVDDNGGHHVFRYADVQQVLSDPRFSSNLGRLMPFLDPQKVAANLIWTDPPRHRQLRGLVSQAFTPKTVARLRPRVADIAAELITALPDGESDIIDALAYPLPVTASSPQTSTVSGSPTPMWRRSRRRCSPPDTSQPRCYWATSCCACGTTPAWSNTSARTGR